MLMSNGHVHVWRMHDHNPPTLVSVWDRLTPNLSDLALSMTLMPRGSLDPDLANLQGRVPFLLPFASRTTEMADHASLLGQPISCHAADNKVSKQLWKQHSMDWCNQGILAAQ